MPSGQMLWIAVGLMVCLWLACGLVATWRDCRDIQREWRR